MKNKRVLLTGASGFFGSHLLRHLLIHTGWDIVCIASWKHKGTPERIQNALNRFQHSTGAFVGIDPNRVKIITHDLVSPLTDITIKEIGQIDYILNIASNSHVERSIDHPDEFILGNSALAFNMLELARKLKPELFLQFSTDEVYGAAPIGVNFKEWSPIVPSNPYSASKAMQEAMAVSYWRTYGVPLIITNTMNLFGETQDPEKFIARLIRKINNNEIVEVHGRKGNIGSRFYLHARSAASAILYIIEHLSPTLYEEEKHTLPDRYNIVGEEELDNLELAKMVAKIMKKPLKYKLVDFHKGRPGHDRRYALDGRKLKKLGWKQPVVLKESLEKTVLWTLKNNQWL